MNGEWVSRDTRCGRVNVRQEEEGNNQTASHKSRKVMGYGNDVRPDIADTLRSSHDEKSVLAHWLSSSARRCNEAKRTSEAAAAIEHA